jgi:hypothetical protein
MGTGSFPGVKWPERGVDHPPPSSAEVKERVELYLYSPSGPSWPVLGRTLPLPPSSGNHSVTVRELFPDDCGNISSMTDDDSLTLVGTIRRCWRYLCSDLKEYLCDYGGNHSLFEGIILWHGGNHSLIIEGSIPRWQGIILLYRREPFSSGGGTHFVIMEGPFCEEIVLWDWREFFPWW